ncbi:undecaprenyldiphospho-muramoylpentapeptide beta-N-acetylglucosaminyltransferase [Candidatus Peregrinibacteria bacterium CG_4_9_14_0_2_um_filter_53_11]|nr:MAG: undecaprenyldiphospho-muramoylpentapeptide beta-N-acetylglucosaminyltransferase [Candidatus Peregrinibacteria bacterium CG_4_9_14_0_2_um_filter_53_11]
MRLVFTGGGTGGHVLPNVAIIQQLKEAAARKHLEIDCAYIGSNKPAERRLVEREADIPFYEISTGKLRRYLSLENFFDFFRVFRGTIQAWRLLGKLRPHLVFSKGGYVSLPVVLAAHFRHIPIWIHEADLSLGLGTRIASRLADRIFLSFEETRRAFDEDDERLMVVGNPIRTSVLRGNKARGYALTGLRRDRPAILFMGGSLGSQALNDLLMAIAQRLVDRGVQLVHITGAQEVEPASSELEAGGYRRYAFLGPELADAYAISDLVVSRAGSGSLFELLALNKPMVLIPLPLSASRGDQIENAYIFEKNGWAITLDQDKLTADELFMTLAGLMEDRSRSASMISRQKKARGLDAAEEVASQLVAFASTFSGERPAAGR